MPPDMLEPIEKSKIDLLDSEYKKQFSRVKYVPAVKHDKHHLSEINTVKNKSPFGGPAGELITGELKFNQQSSTLTTINTKLNSSKERINDDAPSTSTSTLTREKTNAAGSIVKSSSITNLNEQTQFSTERTSLCSKLLYIYIYFFKLLINF